MLELIKLSQLTIHNYLYSILFFIINCIIHNTVQAIEPKQDPKYGNGQTAAFIKTMYGSGTNVTPDEIAILNNTIPQENTNKFFLRLGINKGNSSLMNIKNTSQNIGMETAVIATTNPTANSKYGGEIGLGYRLDKLSWECEFITTENMKYNVTQLFGNQAGSLNSIVKAQGIFINSYYDVIGRKRFRIFLGLGLGAGINKTNSNFFNNPPLSTGESFVRRGVAGAYNLVVGCKINIVPQLFLSASMRYTNFAGFGNVIWRDKKNNLYLQGQHKLVGFSISIMHIFL